MERGWEVLPPQAGQTLQGRYRICSVLGQGGMGCVYLSQTLALDRFVAIKEMHSTISDPEAWAAAVRQFRGEARILASLEHPGLVGVTDYFEEGNACYLVMSFVDGQNLEQVLLASPHALPVAQVLEWVGQVCDILEYLHERPSPVIVRDLKPSNIMLDRTGKIRLVDFGIARVLVPGEHTSTCIRGAGTPGFSPIEQFGAGTTDARSDLYSLGATMYMLLTRTVPPFSMDRMLGQVTLSPPSVLRPDLPPLLDHLILGMMEVQPHDRPASVREVHGALQALGSASPRGAATTWSPPPHRACTSCGGQLAAPDSPCPRCDGAASTRPTEPRPQDAEEASLQRVVDDNVQFTVYRPRSLPPEHWVSLLVFAHLDDLPPDAAPDSPDPIAEVKRRAAKVLGAEASRYQDVTRDSAFPVPRTGEITVSVTLPGVTVNPPRRSFLWLESVHLEEFRLRASAVLLGQQVRGRVTVFLGSIILAEVSLRLRVEESVEIAPSPPPAERVSARPFRRIFASYALEDVMVVAQFERFARAMGDRHVQDWVTLRATGTWDSCIEEAIRGADVFQLFWSNRSMRSSFVQQEWRFALGMQRPGFVRPVYWENPMPCSPEQDLPPLDLLRLDFQYIAPSADEGGPRARPALDESGQRQPAPPAGASHFRCSNPSCGRLYRAEARLAVCAQCGPRWGPPAPSTPRPGEQVADLCPSGSGSVPRPSSHPAMTPRPPSSAAKMPIHPSPATMSPPPPPPAAMSPAHPSPAAMSPSPPSPATMSPSLPSPAAMTICAPSPATANWQPEPAWTSPPAQAQPEHRSRPTRLRTLALVLMVPVAVLLFTLFLGTFQSAPPTSAYPPGAVPVGTSTEGSTPGQAPTTGEAPTTGQAPPTGQAPKLDPTSSIRPVPPASRTPSPSPKASPSPAPSTPPLPTRARPPLLPGQ